MIEVLFLKQPLIYLAFNLINHSNQVPHGLIQGLKLCLKTEIIDDYAKDGGE